VLSREYFSRRKTLKKQVLLLGASGVLGRQLFEILSKSQEIKLSASFQTEQSLEIRNKYPDVKYLALKLDSIFKNPTSFDFNKYDVVINCIGAIKQRGYDDRDMYAINSVFPQIICRNIENSNTRLIHFTTDCVFAGTEVHENNEKRRHDATDQYGLSKSLGEVLQGNVFNLRSSFVGEEERSNYSLLAWFKSQPKGTTINGFTNQFWNGIGALQYAYIVSAIIHQDYYDLMELTHIVPRDQVSKYDLLQLFRKYYDRSDIIIEPAESIDFVYRVISTTYPKTNKELWKIAGYEIIPSIEEMINEQAEFSNLRKL